MSSASFLASSGFLGKGRCPGCCRASRTWGFDGFRVSQAMAEVTQARQEQFKIWESGVRAIAVAKSNLKSTPNRDSAYDGQLQGCRIVAPRPAAKANTTSSNNTRRSICGHRAIGRLAGPSGRMLVSRSYLARFRKTDQELVACSLLLHLPSISRFWSIAALQRMFGQTGGPHRCL